MRLKDHLNKLEYFCAVVEAGSLKRASEIVLIGQPQLTKVVKQLEDILNTPLFLRSSKGVVLTKSGDQLYKFSKQILQKANEAEFSIMSTEGRISGIVRVGTYDSIARYFFPDFLKYLRATAPDLKILLETGKSADVFKKLKNKTLDIAVIVKPTAIPKNIESRRMYTDAFGLYKSPALTSDFQSTLVYFPYPMNNTESVMGQFGFTDPMVCDNLETVRTLAEQSVGVGLLPHRVAKESVMARKLLPHDHPKIKKNTFDNHDIVLCHRKEQKQDEKQFALNEVERFLQIWSKI